MLSIEDLKIDKKFKRLTPETKEQFKALKKLVVSDGEVHGPIIVWKDQNTVVDGHCRVEILKKHPKLKYSIKEIAFGDWQDVMVWIVEHHIARNSFTLWQKLEMAMNCVDYWEAKEEARNNQGARTDLLSPSDKKLEPIDMDKIIAQKVGCSKTYVTMFKKVFNEAKEQTKQRCREGSTSIKNAYESLIAKEAPPKKKKKTVIDIETADILSDSVKNQTVGKKSDIKIPDPKPIVKKMTTSKTPEGSIWFAINPIDGVMQLFQKTFDQEKGEIHVQVNNYSCKRVSQEDGVTILEACHIDGSTEEVSQKDNIDFDEESKKAS